MEPLRDGVQTKIMRVRVSLKRWGTDQNNESQGGASKRWGTDQNNESRGGASQRWGTDQNNESRGGASKRWGTVQNNESGCVERMVVAGVRTLSSPSKLITIDAIAM